LINKFLAVLIAMGLIGCFACDPSLKSTDDTDSAVTIVTNESDIHGGAPVPQVWSDCGGNIGDHPCDFTFVDQYGDMFQLYDNYNTVMVIDFSAMWCSVCNNIAHDAQVFMDSYGDQGFLWVTVLIDNSQGDPPSEQDIQTWADIYGVSDAPVLAADRSIIDLTANDGFPVSSWPTIIVVDKEMVITNGSHGWNESTVTSWVETQLAN